MQFEKGGLWRKWVDNQSCTTRYKGAPSSEDQLREMLAEADRSDLNLRVAGSGHSFTPVAGTGDLAAVHTRHRIRLGHASRPAG